MNEIEKELIEIQSHMATLALEAEMLNERIRRNRFEVRDAMMDFEAALKRLRDAELQLEEEDADNKR